MTVYFPSLFDAQVAAGALMALMVPDDAASRVALEKAIERREAKA